jgi:polysaccharide biosynthesis protein PslH
LFQRIVGPQKVKNLKILSIKKDGKNKCVIHSILTPIDKCEIDVIEMMSKKPKILFTTPLIKHPAIGGPYLRIENTIKALSQISDLTIYCRAPLEMSEIKYYESFSQNIYFSPSTRRINGQVNRFKRICNSFFKKLMKNTLFHEDPDFKDFLYLADKINPDIIWLGYGNISYPLLKYIKQNSSYKVVCDTDSVWSRFVLRGLPYAQNETERKRIEKEGKEKEDEERWGTQLADVTTAVSDIDAEYYRKFVQTLEKVQIFSNVIDLKDYKETPQKPLNFQKPSIYLAGTFWSKSPMEEAARWVIEKVFPVVKKEIPDIHFYIVGSNSDKILDDIQDPSITITGVLPSVLPYLCHVDVAVVPLMFESGTRFKIMEAGACNIPVVSTTLGAEGIPVTHKIDILIADDPENFAREIIELIADPEYSKKIGNHLHALIEEKYSIPTLVQEGKEIINSLLDK